MCEVNGKIFVTTTPIRCTFVGLVWTFDSPFWWLVVIGASLGGLVIIVVTLKIFGSEGLQDFDLAEAVCYPEFCVK